MLMIWSSLARNRSPDPVVLCFFGRIATSDATTESRPVIRRNPENEIAGFRCPKHQNPAIPKPAKTTNAILAQSLSRSSRTTKQPEKQNRLERDLQILRQILKPTELKVGKR